MSGHSHWSTIQRAKGAADIKRGATFTKVANQITIASKLGGSGDPESNPRLRAALDGARAVNMPKENIQRAIDRGLGKLPGQTIEEVIYEGFGPGKVAFYIEAATDNKLRTLQIVKSLFDRSGGSLGGQGSVAHMFSKIGELVVKSKGGNSEEEELELIDLGVLEIEPFEENNIQRYLVYTESSELFTMGNKITQAGYEVESQELVMKPNMSQEISDPELAKKVIEFAGKLEENDDILKVYANADIPENLI